MIVGLDHVVVGLPDLQEGIDWWASRTGVTPRVGGPHEGLGTRNAVAALGAELYVELMSVDPAQQATSAAREWLARLDQPRAFGWCWRCDDAARTHRALEAAGVTAPRVPLRRVRPDGVELEWELVYPLHQLGSAIPFLIDWGATPSPAIGAPSGCTLLEATPVHPDPSAAQGVLDRMGVPAKVLEGPTSGVRLRFDSPRGELVVEP